MDEARSHLVQSLLASSLTDISQSEGMVDVMQFAELDMLRSSARVSALRATGLLDDQPEPAFDRLARLAAQLTGAPALVTLVDAERQVIVSSHGLPPVLAELREVPRSHSLCAVVVERGLPLVLEDARKDARFAHHAAVVEWEIIAYVGVPLVDEEGHALGALAVVGQTPRAWDAATLTAIEELACLGGTAVGRRQQLAERHRAERASQEREIALSESRRELSALPNNLPGLAYCCSNDESGTMDLVSEGVRALTGYGPEDLRSGRITWAALIHPDDRARVADDVKRALDSSRPYTLEYRLLTAAGEERWVREHGCGVHDGSGALASRMGLIQDDTSRHQLDELRCENERTLLVTQEIAQVGSWQWDASTDTITWSSRWCEFLGTTPDQIPKDFLGYLKHLHPDDQTRVRAILEESCTTGARLDFDYRVIRTDGTVRYLHCRGEVRRDRDGRLAGLQGTTVDITDRKVVELALRESEARFRMAADATRDVIIDVDLASGKIEWDGAVVEMLGWPVDDIPPTLAAWRELLHPDDRQCVTTRLESALAGDEELLECAYRIRRAGNKVAHVLSRLRIVRDAVGCAQRLIGAVTDVTERTEAEEALHASEARQRAVVDALGVLTWALDLQTEDAWSHGSLLQHLGYPANVVPGNWTEQQGWWFQHVHPEDRAALVARATALRATAQDEMRAEYRFRRADGSYATLQSNVRVTRDDDGRPMRALGIEVDVSAIADAEHARHESEERFRQLAENSNEMFWLAELGPTIAESRAIYINPAYERITGRSAAQLCASDTLGFLRVAPADVPTVLEAATAVRSGVSRTVEFRLETERGIRVVRSRIFPIRDAAGRTYRIGGVTEDVTEHREAEAALRASEVRYRGFVESAHEGVWAVDAVGKTTYVNPRLATMLDYPAATMVGTPMFAFMDAAAAFVTRTIFATWQRGMCATHDIAFRRADGSELWATVSSSPLRDESGEFAGVVMLVSDVSARRNAEAALRRSEARLIEAQRIARMGSWELDVTTRQVHWSAELFRLVGLPPQDEPISLETFYAVVHPEEREQVRMELRGYLAARRSYDTRFRVLRPDGHVRVHRVVGRMVHDEEGLLVRVIGTTQDVTEQVVAEEALRESEQRFRALIEHAPDVVGILGSDGIIQYQSPSVTRLLGYDVAEMVGRLALAFVHADDVTEASARFSQVLATPGALTQLQYRCRHRDGSWRSLETHLWNLVNDPAVRGVVINARDITGQQALESQLRQSQKMEAVGQLAGGIAHDFNNLLTVINASTSFARESLPPGAPAIEELTAVDEAAARAAQLTRQLLAFSRKQLLKPEVLDLNSIVRRLEPMLHRLIGEDIQVLVTPASPLQPVLADPGQIEQVLVNLSVNARDAMPRGGRLTIETMSVEVTDADAVSGGSELPLGRYTRLRVCDNGAGMSDATLAHIFEPFFTTKEPGRGTGLGLSTVYGIVKQSGGFIRVFSVLDYGTTFEIDLPAVIDDVPVASASARSAAIAPVTGTILVAEDDSAVRGLVRRILAGAGYTVLEAANGREALDVASSHSDPIDLALTDMVMPEMNGRSFSEQLSERHPGVRVLFMSGYTNDEILRRGLVMPGASFLEKPFTAERLLSCVRDMLSQ